MPDKLTLFATCAKRLEPLVASELQELGAEDVKETVAGVHFKGSMELALSACLWSRCANRILMPLFVSGTSAQDLYTKAMEYPWFSLMKNHATLWINFTLGARNNNQDANNIRHSQFGAQKLKDAVCDYYRQQGQQRPNIVSEGADITLHARAHRDTISVSLDLSGHSLHQRGYRLDGGQAPLRETLAAAMLMRSQWHQHTDVNTCLIDPMCGSGTLLIEAAMMRLNYAPGLHRHHWGFMAWRQYDATLWDTLKQQAQQQLQQSMIDMKAQGSYCAIGADQDSWMVKRSSANIARAGLIDFIKVSTQSIESPVEFNEQQGGLIIVNPPYGERIGDKDKLVTLYNQLGTFLKAEQFKSQNWQAAVLVHNKEMGKAIGIHSHRQYQLYNGALPCTLLQFELKEEQFITEATEGLSPEMEMVVNRLKKNYQYLKKWLVQNEIECYRLYSADLPEYAAIIDVYQDQFLIQEYQAPSEILPTKREFRWRQVLKALRYYSQSDSDQGETDNIHIRVRKQQKGKQQYTALNNSKSTDFSTNAQQEVTNRQLGFDVDQHMIVREWGIQYYVNLTNYLDSGLFIDHRRLRATLLAESKGKTVLNLFCYTASLSLAAVLGGAVKTVSVDQSKTYLTWAQHNFKVNDQRGYLIVDQYQAQSVDVTKSDHFLLRGDCLQWLQQQNQREESLKYDMIVLDPPSFSNSKNMEQTLDIQQHHVTLIEACTPLLASNGTLYFSTNKRKFKLDASISNHYRINNISNQTIDKDYSRSTMGSKVHQCWTIQLKA